MNTISAGAQSYIGQLLASQQLNASASGASFSSADEPDEAAPSSGGNLTGSTTAALSTQTLQALLGIGQSDDPQDPSSASPPQGAHRHHHHHGGPPPSQTTSSTSTTSASTSTSTSASDPTASIAEGASADSNTDDGLETALAL